MFMGSRITILRGMSDNSGEAALIGNGDVPAKHASVANWRTKSERRLPTWSLSRWGARASVLELLIALSIILFAVVFICTAPGREIFNAGVNEGVKPFTLSRLKMTGD